MFGVTGPEVNVLFSFLLTQLLKFYHRYLGTSGSTPRGFSHPGTAAWSGVWTGLPTNERLGLVAVGRPCGFGSDTTVDGRKIKDLLFPNNVGPYE